MSVAGPHIVIIGGGITGLAAAYRLCSLKGDQPLACTVLEASQTWGGKIQTRYRHGFVLEAGPDSFLSHKPWALELCEALGLTDHLMGTRPGQCGAAIFSRGRLRPLPEGLVLMVPARLGPFLRSGLLTWPGLLRMAMDLVLPAKPARSHDGRSPGDDESIASFFQRRFGREAFECLIEPLMAGIYAGDANQLSLRATFPQFLELERKHGSLIRSLLTSRRSMRASAAPKWTSFVTLRHGLSTLIDALVKHLGTVGIALERGTAVRAVSRRHEGDSRYRVELESGRTIEANAVILSTPAFVSARLIETMAPDAARLLTAIPYASTATVSLAYDNEDPGPGVRGFGFVVPRVERRSLLAATWTSLKWAHRAPPASTLVRCYVGGQGSEDTVQEDDKTLVDRVRHDLHEMAGIGRMPLFTEVHRWPAAMPQYMIGHLDRLAKMHEALAPFQGLAVTGAGYSGVGIPDCIRQGNETAERMWKIFAGSACELRS